MIVDIDLAPITVLIIDDSRYARSFLKSALLSFGVRRTLEAGDGATGIHILAEQKVDLILVDHDMEPINGIDFTRLLRAGEVPGCRDLPVIMISGLAEMDKVVEARDAGVTEFLAKPVSADSLFRRVRKALVNPRPFVTGGTYAGPCRRTADRGAPDGAGERRRAPPLIKPKPLVAVRQGSTRPAPDVAVAVAAKAAAGAAEKTGRKRFKAGTVIFEEGSEGHEAYVVETGRVCIFKMTEGRKMVLGHLGPQGVFGEMALIDGEPRMASAEATEDTVCLVIPKPALAAQISRTPDLVILVLETLLQDVRTMGHALVEVRARLQERRSGISLPDRR